MADIPNLSEVAFAVSAGLPLTILGHRYVPDEPPSVKPSARRALHDGELLALDLLEQNSPWWLLPLMRTQTRPLRLLIETAKVAE